MPHHVVDGPRPCGGVVQSKVRCVARSSKRDAVVDLERRLGAEVVPEALADAGEMTVNRRPTGTPPPISDKALISGDLPGSRSAPTGTPPRTNLVFPSELYNARGWGPPLDADSHWI